MEIYDHPTFRMACQQFDLVADHLQMPAAERDRVKYPKRSMTVALPIHRDDGSTQVFTGYRVQHHLTLGPTKGGLRFHPGRDAGRSGGAGDVDELEMRADRPALRRRQGRRRLRPRQTVQDRTGAPHAPLHAGNDSVHRPAGGRHGPRPGHQRADHGLDDGHLLRPRRRHRAQHRHRQTGRPGRLARAGAKPPAAASATWSTAPRTPSAWTSARPPPSSRALATSAPSPPSRWPATA